MEDLAPTTPVTAQEGGAVNVVVRGPIKLRTGKEVVV